MISTEVWLEVNKFSEVLFKATIKTRMDRNWIGVEKEGILEWQNKAWKSVWERRTR